MGTTADKLQKILDSKNAIKTKFNLADDLPFAEYVNNISGSGADVTLGVVDAEGRFQPLTFDVLNGEIVNAPEEVTAFYTWDSPLDTPDIGQVDLSFITAAADDVLAGKVTANSNGQPITGTLVRGTDVSGTTALAADVLEGKKFYTADGAFETGTLVKGTDVSGTTATAEDVKEGKQFYNASGILTQGTNTDINVSATTAIADDVLEGKQFYSADGTLTQGTLVPSSTGGTSGGGEFYLCKYVNRNYFSTDTIIASGFSTDVFVGATALDDSWSSIEVPADIAARDPNGTYTYSAEDELWISENGCVIGSDKMGSGGFAIDPAKDYRGTGRLTMSGMGMESYPVPEEYNVSYDWYNKDWNVISGATVINPLPPEVEKYWLGYLLNMNEDGKWEIDYSAEVRKTYADYMPVAGRFYDGGCTMEILNLNIAEEFLLSTPTNMTANENDEWLVSASDEYTGSDGVTYYTYFAFNTSDDKFWRSSGSGQLLWIQWQCKTHAVILKRLEMYKTSDSLPMLSDWEKSVFQASNNGTDWETIPYSKLEDDSDKGCKVLYFDNNYTFYNYFRFYRPSDSNNSSWWSINGLIGYYLETREIPK